MRVEDIRERQRLTWAGLSPGWEKWDSVIMDQLRPVGDAMLDRLDIRDGGNHLDVASGTGEPGLTVARRSPNGRTVLTDLVPEMLDIARRRAASQGLANVEIAVCSADGIPFDDGSFDSVSVRFGYMFFPDLAAVTSELVRVLAPGGRICSAVWIEPELNPWTSIVTDAVTAEMDLPPGDPDSPNMYRCAAPGRLEALYSDAGLHDVAGVDVAVELVTRSPQEYWEMISEHVSLAVAALQQLDPHAVDQVRASVLSTVRSFEDDDGQVRVPGLARCVVGTK